MLYTLFVDISNFCSPSLKTCSLQETAGANVTRNTLQWKKGFFRELTLCSSGFIWISSKNNDFTNECIYF